MSAWVEIFPADAKPKIKLGLAIFILDIDFNEKKVAENEGHYRMIKEVDYSRR